MLFEDGDPGHGTKAYGLAARKRDANWIPTLVHPAQSPDLNASEGIWNMLKQRVRKRTWSTHAEGEAVIQAEWAAIDQSEVQKRINEMSERCRKLATGDGGPIRSNLW